LIFVNFPQFFVFLCEASGRSPLASGEVDFRCPDDIFFGSPDRRSLVVRTRAATNGRTVRINRLDGDPSRAIYTPGCRILHPTPPKYPFLAFCAIRSVSFWLYIAFSCLFAHYSHIPGIFNLFLFSLVIFKLLEFYFVLECFLGAFFCCVGPDCIMMFFAVILPNFCCDLTRIFLDYFLQILVGFFL
jgi:hypothetical protein